MPALDRFAGWMGQGATPSTSQGSSPGNSGAQTPPSSGPQIPPNGENHGGSHNENHEANHDALINDIWKEAETTPPAKDAPPAQPGSPPVTKTKADLQREVKEYLTGLELGDITLSEQQIETLKSGEGWQDFTTHINDKIQKSFLQSVTEVQKLLNARLPKMVDEAVNKSRSIFEGDKLRGMLHDKYPFTTDPAVGPVAESVLRRFMEKPGTTHEKALELTGKFFERMRNLTGGESEGGGFAPTNEGGSFRRNPSVPKEVKNWLDVLAPDNRSG